MVYSVEVRPLSVRPTCPQLTSHSCASASAVDGVGDLLSWTARERAEAQTALNRFLGGLRTRGTTLDRVAEGLGHLVGGRLLVEVGKAPLSEAVGLAAMGNAVVVGLAATHPGAVEGHAVRLEAGEGTLPQRSGDPVLDGILRESNERLADLALFSVTLFDPWPSVGRLSTTVPVLRPRFERAGSQVLLVARR